MSNLPDYYNDGAFSRTIGSRMTDAEQVWEAHAAKINDTVNRAYQEWPLYDFVHSTQRWLLIGGALQKAEDAMKEFTSITVYYHQKLLAEYCRAMDADANHDKQSVSEAVGDYMHLYSLAIERSVA